MCKESGEHDIAESANDGRRSGPRERGAADTKVTAEKLTALRTSAAMQPAGAPRAPAATPNVFQSRRREAGREEALENEPHQRRRRASSTAGEAARGTTHITVNDRYYEIQNQSK
jgi:hypothetical protein